MVETVGSARLARVALITGLFVLVIGPVVALAIVLGDSGSGTDVPLASPCVGGATRPLTAKKVVRAFRSVGISAIASTKTADCDAADSSTAYAITNAGRDDKEGLLSCLLQRTPLYRPVLDLDLKAPSYSPMFSGRKATFYFANISCFYYPDTDEQLTGFARAARRVARLG